MAEPAHKRIPLAELEASAATERVAEMASEIGAHLERGARAQAVGGVLDATGSHLDATGSHLDATGSHLGDDADDADDLASMRPSWDFVDGFLAAAAALTGALSQGAENVFYSFEWIGDGEEEREQALFGAFQSDPNRMTLQIEPLASWRPEVERIATKWLGRRLPEGAGAVMAVEFLEVMTAFLGDDEVDAFLVRAEAPPGLDAPEPPIGVEFDHVLFETPGGRVFLEFTAVV